MVLRYEAHAIFLMLDKLSVKPFIHRLVTCVEPALNHENLFIQERHLFEGQIGEHQEQGAWFDLAPGDSVTAWLMSDVEEVYFPGTVSPAKDPVNYRFINGFVDVGDLPCRKAFWETMVGRSIPLEDKWPVSELCLPGSNRRVEFTGFWHVPTHIRRWLRGRFRSPQGQRLRFSLSTCGGVRVWVNGTEVCRFEPFQRNIASTTEIEIEFSAGDNDVLIHTEDLAERDTIWFVELRLISDGLLRVDLPATFDRAAIARLENLSRTARPARDVFVDHPLEVLFDEPAGADVEVKVEIISHGHEHAILATGRVLIGAHSRSFVFASDARIPDGYHSVRLSFSDGTSKAVRALDAAFMSSLMPSHGNPSLRHRKKAALAHAANFGVERIGRALAMIATGKIEGELFKRILDATLETIDRREDCSDFVMVPLLWLVRAYSSDLVSADAARVRHSVLSYRYWVDEPGNDTMWFWSENHVLCFHVSQLLAGLSFPDEVFLASGRIGAVQASIAIKRLESWFDSVEAHGLAEWNSAAYYPVDFIGLLALERWAPEQIADRARRLLDLIFRMVSLHTLAGVPAGSQGRAYDKELRAGPLTELAPFAMVAFGSGWMNNGVASLPLFCLGDYEPPANLRNFAQLAVGRSIEARYSQGLEAGNLVLFKNDAAQLSSVVDHKTGRKGHQQHVIDIKLSGHPMARLWVNNPGEDDPWGSQRPSYWAGNGTLPRVGQHLDTVLAVFDTTESRLKWTHAYIGRDGFDEITIDGNWLLARSGQGFAALYCSNGIELVEAGTTAGREVRSQGGSVCGWAAVVSSGQEDGFDDFKINVLASITVFDVSTRTLSLQLPGRSHVLLGYESGLVVGGVPAPFRHFQPEPIITFDSALDATGQYRSLSEKIA